MKEDLDIVNYRSKGFRNVDWRNVDGQLTFRGNPNFV